MITWLQQSFQENTLLWLLLSSIVGGIVGASTKLLFEVLVPEKIQEKREIIRIKRKYSTPVLLAAAELRGRLGNIIKYIDTIEVEGWLAEDNPRDYYLPSTYYVVGQFFGWLQILRKTIVYLDLSSTKETRKFEYYLDAIEKGFSSPSLLQKSLTGHPENTSDQWIYSFWLQAIGEVMIVQINDKPSIMDYATFYKSLIQDDNEDFQRWVKSLGELFRDLTVRDLRFKRVVAIHCILNAFIDYLDPKHLRTKKVPYYWEHLSKEEATLLKQKIERVGIDT